eukprot:1383727-Rhodomonas_salina.4
MSWPVARRLWFLVIDFAPYATAHRAPTHTRQSPPVPGSGCTALRRNGRAAHRRGWSLVAASPLSVLDCA